MGEPRLHMVTHEIRIRIVLTQRKARWALFALLCLAFPKFAGTGDVSTLTMYYPPASATYKTLTTTGKTMLATDSGNVVFGNPDMTKPDATPHDKTPVSIGKGPDTKYRLRIYGTLWVDGCIWLQNNQMGSNNSNQNYRCRWPE
ncbi:MAG: hypothetical protein HY922_16680 [Elusimicrobia bacterium]|nr:hypothetical protein [Elusimicrobiota bacterium]